MSIGKLVEDVKILKFQKGDILVVKLKEHRTHLEAEMIKDALEQVIPKDLNVQIIMSNSDVDFEILRRNNSLNI